MQSSLQPFYRLCTGFRQNDANLSDKKITDGFFGGNASYREFCREGFLVDSNLESQCETKLPRIILRYESEVLLTPKAAEPPVL